MFRKKKKKQQFIGKLRGLATEANLNSEIADNKSRNFEPRTAMRIDLGVMSAYWDGRAKAYEQLIKDLEQEN